ESRDDVYGPSTLSFIGRDYSALNFPMKSRGVKHGTTNRYMLARKRSAGGSKVRVRTLIGCLRREYRFGMIFLTSKHLFWGTVNRSGAGTPHALSFVVNKPERRLLERQLKVVATPLALLSGAKEPWSTCSGGNKGGQRVHSGGRDSHNLSLRTHCDAQLSHAQAPGPRGSPHEPHAPIAGCGSPPPLLLTANVDSSFSSLALLHVGQV